MTRPGTRAAAVALLGAALALAPATGARAQEGAGLELVAASKAVFSRPHDVVLSPDGRYLMVADLGNDAVRVIDPESLAVLADIGRGRLSAPHDVAFDADGRLLVADTGNDRIAVFRFDGLGPDGKARAELVESWTEHMGAPEGVAVGGGGRVYVTNAYLDTVLALERGRVVIKVGEQGDGPNQYVRPHDIHVDNRGRVLVVDSGNNRIQVLNRDLVFLRGLAGPPYDFLEPKYMTVDGNGWLFIADQHHDRILILDDAYRPVGVYGGVRGSGPGQLDKPEGVEVRGPRVWVADTYNDRVLRLRRR